MTWLADLLLVLSSPAGLATMGLAVAGLLVPRRFVSRLRPVERALSRAFRRFPVLLCTTAALLLYAAAGVVRMPTPVIHDEFANLLAADTFRHGRLANPPHPHWRHFENFHIIQQPSYASKFPPATAFALAIGMILGHPIIGMWLVIAALAAAVVWALSACLPRSWAVIGTMFVITYPLVFAWGESYWGGAMAILGSALFVGGVAHLLGSPRNPRFAAVAIAAGLAILLCTRPYEGAALTVGVCVAVLLFARNRIRPLIRTVVLSCVAILIPTALFLLYYNWRITGDPLLLPYTHYQRNYDPAPLFLWQQARPAELTAPPEMERLYANHARRAQGLKSWSGWSREARATLRRIAEDYCTLTSEWTRWLPAIVLIPLPLVVARNRTIRGTIVIALVTLAAVLCVTWYMPYFLAVLFPLLALAWMDSLRRIRACVIGGRRPGLLWSRVVVVAWMAAFAVEFTRWKDVPPMFRGAVVREQLQRQLERSPGRDLVLVTYGRGHFPHVSWTYNSADIDRAPVIWARSLSPAENRRLIEAFPNRHVWTIEPNRELKLERATGFELRPTAFGTAKWPLTPSVWRRTLCRYLLARLAHPKERPGALLPEVRATSCSFADGFGGTRTSSRPVPPLL